MPDDKNVIAIFYGPVLLAFESASELILKGDGDNILSKLSVADSKSNTFHLINNGKTYSLKPLYDIEAESYGVYATIREFQENIFPFLCSGLIFFFTELVNGHQQYDKSSCPNTLFMIKLSNNSPAVELL